MVTKDEKLLGLYEDIGKKTRDLLFNNFQSGVNINIQTPFLNGGYLPKMYRLEDLVGQENLSTSLSLTSGEVRVGLHLKSVNYGLSTSVGLTARPLVHFSALAGTKALCFGADVSLSTATLVFDKFNIVLSSTLRNANISLAVNNGGDQLKASFYHLLCPGTSTAFGAEVTLKVSSNEKTIATGVHHMFDAGISVNARIYSGRVGIVAKHPVGPHSISIYGEAGLKGMKASTTMGLGLDLRL